MDTIVAQATANGLAGLAVVRISGKNAFEIADKCFRGKRKISNAKSHIILYGSFYCKGEMLDDVTASIFRSPHSYTGEDVVEIGCHGGAVVPMQIIRALVDAGCRYAEAGEFTRRAFINKRLSLVQVEAVGDIIHAVSVPSSEVSARQLHSGITAQFQAMRTKLLDTAAILELEMDFADEDVPIVDKDNVLLLLDNSMSICNDLLDTFQASTILRNGFNIAIIGKPNSGKSTLFNALLRRERAIVSDIPGTTRDYINEQMLIDGIPVTLVDTAGLRETKDTIEIEGIKYAEQTLLEANLILFINDISQGENYSDSLFQSIVERIGEIPYIMVHNKIDCLGIKEKNCENHFFISARTGEGLDVLRTTISQFIKELSNTSNNLLLNERQYHKLNETLKALNLAVENIQNDMPNEIIAIEIRNAGRTLGELTGETWSEEVLNNIFSNFCIGK